MTEQAEGLEGEPLVFRRISSALDAAGRARVDLSVDELLELLPEDDLRLDQRVREWLTLNARGAPPPITARAGPAFPSEGAPVSERARRGEQYLEAAHVLVGTDLRLVGRLLRFVGVTGSTAYGEPEAGDDCDLMVVARPGGVWPFLAFALLRLRGQLRADYDGGPSSWCFNYVVDEEEVRRDFGRPRGFLFAREALTTRPVLGDGFYRGLLQSAAWLHAEAPRLMRRWEGGTSPPSLLPKRDSVFLGALNVVLFPFVAAYLQLKNLRCNFESRNAGRPEGCFRTITQLGRMAFVTVKFDQLKTLYAPATAVPPES